jgi:hypothetical protein
MTDGRVSRDERLQKGFISWRTCLSPLYRPLNIVVNNRMTLFGGQAPQAISSQRVAEPQRLAQEALISACPEPSQVTCCLICF